MPGNGTRSAGSRPAKGNGGANGKNGATDGRRNGVPPEDPERSAKAAGLRYVSDEGPGITRRRRGRGWSYYEPDGTLIRDPDVRARIDSIAIPPAWKHVWICPHPRGHIQATGRDDRGRKQYRYHGRWREVRDATKFHRMVAFGEALPAIRQRVDELLRKRKLTRERVLATVVRLLETTCIRVGNDEYSRENGTFGLTTIRNRHVSIDGSEIRFRFEGKGGKKIEAAVDDTRVARAVRDCQEIPGYELFQYLDEEGERRDIKSEDVNEFIREITGQSFTAKDFRTWLGTLHAFIRLRDCGPAEDESAAKKNCLTAIDYVADQLANTRAVCRSSYIHPAVLEGYGEGAMADVFGELDETGEAHLDPEEVALLQYLKSES